MFYEVFVRSFADSTSGPLANDGVGDLAGLTARLDVLNDGDPNSHADLGVGALWLMPIFPSPSYHGYDVTNYRDVNPRYGTLADVDALLAAAHARGMKVILDFVPNHTSREHPWFVDSRSTATAQKRGFYQWRSSDPLWTQPWNGTVKAWHADTTGFYYGVFWQGMPDLDLTNAAVEAEILEAMKFWLARGVDGFRLDAVRYLVETDAGQQDLPETHAALHRMRRALQLSYPDVLLVGEAWGNSPTVATYWGEGEELQLAFGFEVADAVVNGTKSGNAGGVLAAVSAAQLALTGKDPAFQAPFLTNHDQVRVMRQLGGDSGAARVAAATLFALPGPPFLYYGEELGMQGGSGPADECKRTPVRWTASGPGYGFTEGTAWNTRPPAVNEQSWTPCVAPEADAVDVATQRADSGSLWHLYRKAVALRTGSPALSTGPVSYPATAGGGVGVLALVRGATGARILYVANLAASPTGAFTVNVTGTPDVLLSEGVASPPSPSGGQLSFPGLAARGFAFYALD